MTKKLRNTLLTLAALVLASGALAEHNHQPARPEDNCIVDLATNEVHCPGTLPTTRERRRVPDDNTPGAVPDLLQIIDGFAKKKRKADARPDYEKLYVELVAALCAENLKYPRRMLFDDHFWAQRDFSGVEYFGNGSNNPGGDFNARLECPERFRRTR